LLVERVTWHFGEHMDDDLASMTREALIAEIRRLRAGIRAHRDSSGHDLCWVAVPPWPSFMRGCIAYRESLDRELANAPVIDVEFGNN
jgi:hypothetical protein